MAEPVRGVKRLLARARVYELVQVGLGTNTSHRRFIEEYVRPRAGERMLDIGCGTGHVLRALAEDIDYVGIDVSSDYIAAARRTWVARGEFHLVDVGDGSVATDRVDIALVMGLIHHLDDEQTAAMLRLATEALAPGGRFVAVEPAWVPGQPRVAHWLIGRDRGEHVRDVAAYRALVEPWFGSVEVAVRHDLLRVPYTHMILQCAEPATQSAASASSHPGAATSRV